MNTTTPDTVTDPEFPQDGYSVGGSVIEGTPDEEPKVEAKSIEEVKARLADLKSRAAALKPLMNRKQRRAAEAEARRIRKKKLKNR